MTRNFGSASRPERFVDRGASFITRATLVSCVHGEMKGGNGYATLLAMKFTFSPMKSGRRARMANIMLQFMGKGGVAGPRVVDLVPGSIAVNRSEARTESVDVGPAGLDGATTQETITKSKRHIGVDFGLPNAAVWTIKEKEGCKQGIPESLTAIILLSRADQEPFIMVPTLDVKVSGSAFEAALSRRLPDGDPVGFDPTSTSTAWNLPLHSTEIDEKNLEDFWRNYVLKIDDLQSPPHAVSPISDLPRDDYINAADVQQPTEAVTLQSPKDSISPIQSHESSDNGSAEFRPEFDEAITRAIYTKLWTGNTAEFGSLRRLRSGWKDVGDIPDDCKLSDKFSWLKKELDLPDISDIEGEHQSFRTNVAEDTKHEFKHRPKKAAGNMHTMCSLLIRKAKRQTSFKSFQDLSQGELFNEKTMDLITKFFELENEDYNGFRQLDFGSCEFLWSGEGRDLSIFYIIQTPYYSSGFWSMFLVGKADPEDPDRSRKLSGLIQSGADVDLEQILDKTASKVEAFDYHPLLLPYHLFVNHYENTSKQFDMVLKEVEKVELRIMYELESNSGTTSQARSGADADDDQEPNHWGLANLSKSLHKASMEVAEVARRRQFEGNLLKAFKDELDRKRPAQNQMLLALNRYDRGAKAHHLDIQGMPDKIESLKNLLYSMIAQQDNVMSIKLAREGLSDSKAMKTLSFITILFLPGTFVATLFTTDVVSFQDSAVETRVYIKVVVPLTIGLLILYGLWLLVWKAPLWSRARRRMRDPEAGNMRIFYKSSHTPVKTEKQS